jgi:hypothetical protein
MPKKHEREKLRQTNVRLSPLGNRLLNALAEYHGVNKTAVIDMLLRDQARAVGLLAHTLPVAVLEDVSEDVEHAATRDELAGSPQPAKP